MREPPMQARLLLVDALETDDFREVADPALECRFSKTEMRRMVEAAAACVRHSAAKRPRMVQVITSKTRTCQCKRPRMMEGTN